MIIHSKSEYLYAESVPMGCKVLAGQYIQPFKMSRIMCSAYEVSNTWKILKCVGGGVQWVNHLGFLRFDSISLLLMVISSSVNFLIYCTGIEQFKVSK